MPHDLVDSPALDMLAGWELLPQSTRKMEYSLIIRHQSRKVNIGLPLSQVLVPVILYRAVRISSCMASGDLTKWVDDYLVITYVAS